MTKNLTSKRISSIDVMRGLTLFGMLFLGDLNMEVAPAWMGHRPADFDGMGLADWFFPGFLFMVGMSIPFAFSNRLSRGESVSKINLHILTRTLSLLFIGVLMRNTGRVDQDLTGMGENLWSLLMYIAVFLVWNDYSEKLNPRLRDSLKILGLTILMFLVAIFRSGQSESYGWLAIGWWGILGLIGWGYLVSAFTYLFCKDSILKVLIVTLFFLFVNIFSNREFYGFMNLAEQILGTLIEGSVPFIVLTGLLGGMILRHSSVAEARKVISIFIGLGIFCLVSGFVLRQWFIISKIQATPSWGMICSGISYLFFAFIYWVVDVRNKKRWANFVGPASKHSLTTYLAPNILYYLIWISDKPILIYKESSSPWIVVAGSMVWALLMLRFVGQLTKNHIQLKLG